MKTQIVITTSWLFLTLLFANIADTFFFAKIGNFDHFASLVFLACEVSFFACLWVFVLTENTMLFSWIKAFFENLGERYYFKDNVIDFEKKHTFDYLMKPFFTCEICTGANLAFWAYAFSHLHQFIFIDLLFTISVVSFITITTLQTWKQYQTP